MPDDEPTPAGAGDLTVRFPELPALPATDYSGNPMFRGTVRARTAHTAGAAGELTVMATTFDPTAGTVWHSHESDQTLVVLSGAGSLEYTDGVHVLAAGDVVVVPRGRRHRHLAGADSPMTHVSVTSYEPQ